MSFGKAFDAFVGGLDSGLKSGSNLQDASLRRRPAKEAADIDRNVKLEARTPVQGLGTLKRAVQTNSDEAIPTQTAMNSTDEDPTAYAAQGGYMDPVELSNGDYARQEAERTGAIPTAASNAPRASDAAPVQPVKSTLPAKAEDGTPTPPPRPIEGGTESARSGDLTNDGNIIQKTVQWVADQPPLPAAGAIPDGERPTGPVHPIQTMVDPSGKSYPDLTTFLGGVRQTTGAPADRPLQTSDHIDFLQRRMQYAAAHGYDMNAAMQFNVQYLDNLRFQASRTFALASAAWDAGDGNAVQKFVKMGYGFVPDGLSAQTSFANGKLTVQAVDEKTGKAVGTPQTFDKDTFMQKAGGITGDPISFGRALENTPYTTGTTRGAGRSRGGGYGRRASAEGAGGEGTKAEKPLPASVFKGRDLGVATRIRDAIDDPQAGRTAGHIKDYIARAKGPPREGEGGFGLYDGEGKLIVKMNPGKLGVQPNKVAGAEPQGPPAPPAAPAAPGLKPTKSGPAVAGAPSAKPGSAAASTGPAATAPAPKPAPTKQAIPDDYPEEAVSREVQPEGPSIWEQGRRAVVGGIEEARQSISSRIHKNLGTPSTPAPETRDTSGDAMVRISAMEKKLDAARKAGAPEGSLRIMQAQIDRERANLK